MSEYTAIETRNGIRYLKDKKLFAKGNIPANIFPLIKVGETVSDENVRLEAPLKECLFCGVPCKNVRLLNQQTVALCDEHYYSKTLGQVAQKVRESQTAPA